MDKSSIKSPSSLMAFTISMGHSSYVIKSYQISINIINPPWHLPVLSCFIHRISINPPSDWCPMRWCGAPPRMHWGRSRSPAPVISLGFHWDFAGISWCWIWFNGISWDIQTVFVWRGHRDDWQGEIQIQTSLFNFIYMGMGQNPGT